MSGPNSPSFPELYQAQFEYAWASLRRLGVPPEAQEDAVQDLFLVVYRRLPEFAGRSSLKTWIFGVARRVAARHRRTEARRLRRHARLAAVPDDAPAHTDDELARREARRRLAEFLDGLDDDRRAVFVLHLYEEMSATEIAQTLGVNVNTVYSRIRLVREQFDRTFAAVAPTALRSARTPEAPPRGAQARVWAALLLALGAASAAPGAALAQGAAAAGHSAAAWTLGLAVAGTLVIVAARPAAPTTAEAADRSSAPSHTRAGDAAARPDSRSDSGDTHATTASHVDARGAEAPPAAPSRKNSGESEAPLPPADLSPPDARAAGASPEAPPAVAPRHVHRQSDAADLDEGDSSAHARDPAHASTRAHAPSQPSAALSAEDLAREAARITAARAAIEAGRTDEALAELRRHQREFPTGVLQRERLGLRAIALCRSGRTREGQREGEAFLHAHPDSALAARVRLDCTLPATNSPDREPTP
ncbi:RNA polymerase sigma factor [Nannocystis bainbridge]|uniref:Sigma-70 family RNA polymerase sigma factor n=1 Tax=Nannocystis bainbridge TaxID=2995303 RepID=A0ABT5EBR6_9BACT|nr:sigma-70 family RNA polymerase sigma factor [Nannocystis bainbridge]MDC0722878.1 sigma-70 family RNA polymerase sigma factor [Nannocystis bainbridge]